MRSRPRKQEPNVVQGLYAAAVWRRHPRPGALPQEDCRDHGRVLHKWQEDDVLVFDNVVAQHGRQPWEGAQEDRIVYASLFDGALPGAYNDKPWAQVVQALDG